MQSMLYALSRMIRMPEHWRESRLPPRLLRGSASFIWRRCCFGMSSSPSAWPSRGLCSRWCSSNSDNFARFARFGCRPTLALLASFIRIFFVNLTAGTTGELLGPRMTTVAPLALIYFFVYSQMKLSEKNEEARWSIDSILAYVGSLTVASLLYFQVPGGWIATAWSVMVFCLLATALLLDREVFLHQGLLLSIAAFFRGVMHNLFGASYFSDGTWSGPYLELGSAIFVMLAALPIALKLKNKYLPEPKKGRLRTFSRSSPAVRSRSCSSSPSCC